MPSLRRMKSAPPFAPSHSFMVEWSLIHFFEQSAALLAAIKEYDANKWKVIGAKLGKPAKVILEISITKKFLTRYLGLRTIRKRAFLGEVSRVWRINGCCGLIHSISLQVNHATFVQGSSFLQSSRSLLDFYGHSSFLGLKIFLEFLMAGILSPFILCISPMCIGFAVISQHTRKDWPRRVHNLDFWWRSYASCEILAVVGYIGSLTESYFFVPVTCSWLLLHHAIVYHGLEDLGSDMSGLLRHRISSGSYDRQAHRITWEIMLEVCMQPGCGWRPIPQVEV